MYQKFSNFVKEHRIERDDFCRAIHFVLPMDEFQDCFKQISFPVTNEDIYQIFREHNAHKSGYLPMEEFYAKLSCWRDYQSKKDAELREIRDSANKVLDNNKINYESG